MRRMGNEMGQIRKISQLIQNYVFFFYFFDPERKALKAQSFTRRKLEHFPNF